MTVSTTPTAPELEDVVYPESDGQPLGETGFHVKALFLLHQFLMDLLAGRTDVYIGVDLFLYYERGNPRAVKAPDVMVIFGVGDHERRTFKTWEERAVPAVIFEISSDETFEEDLHGKREVYQRLGVAEYFLFDPLGDCLDPRLQGFRLENGQFIALVPEADGGLTSAQLGVRLVPDGFLLRLIDPHTGQPLPTSGEKTARLRQETERLQRALAERARERQEKERERQEKEREQHRNAELAAEVARLRALLDQQGRTE